MEKMKMESANLTDMNIDKIAALFPNCITETADENGKLKKAINFDMLRAMLSEDIAEGDEAYEFTWVGKKAAIAEANRPIRKTLRPVMNDETVPTGKDSEGNPYCSSGSVNWDTTENLYIEGDNLEVLKLLQESYLGKVKMIYIDPPYNTGNDFIYRDDFSIDIDTWNEMTMNADEDGNRLFKNTDSNGRFHSDWCSMIYSRLMLARNLLSDDGSIFVSIDYNEVENLKKIMDEVFGPDNFQREIIWRIGWLSGYKTVAPNFIRNHDTILFYSKSSYRVDFIKHYLMNEQFKPLVKDDAALRSKMSELGLDKEKQKALIKYINHDSRPEKYPIEDTWNSNEYDDLNSIAIVSFSGEKISKILDINQDFKGQKSIKMLMRIISSIVREEDIVLDFFSGTGSTAHAVMQLNAEDGGHRKFIMVQLPEETDEKSEAYKAGYKNICEIGKERIRRAGAKIKSETGADIDYGFRVLKLDDTNMQDVYYTPAETNQQMLLGFESNIKPDRTDLDLLFGCLLDWGLPLSMPYSSEQIEGVTVHTYNDGDLIACFDKAIPESVIKTIAKRQPLRVVFRDDSFADSPSKINVSEIFKMLSPDTRVKVI